MQLLLLHACAAVCFASGAALESIDVEPVWAGHPVGFCLYTYHDRQFAAYYDADRQMKVAARKLDSREWDIVKLPESLGWDSHNSVTLAIDREGFLHLSGNMHVVPLVYYRTRKPLDIDTFERAPMVGNHEDRCTYPQFIDGPNGELYFTYRDGRSGSGDQIYNVYDTATSAWRRLLDTPLTSGLGKCNAYFDGPRLGPDGIFHLAWVWRNTPACETNHDISYARSADLVHWETVSGKSLALPITPGPDVVVDPVPPGGGVINGGVRVGFDSQNRPLISYHKYDASGQTQLYVARFDDGAWTTHQLSEWDYRWAFTGGGSIKSEISVAPIHPFKHGKLEQGFTHVKYGSGKFIVDEATLKPIKCVISKSQKTAKPAPKTDGGPALLARETGDRGASDDHRYRYVMRWETLGPNRDRPREGAIPPPSMLRVVRVPTGNDAETTGKK